ncbi:DUF732 domain-containing protein [Mycolicibacterium vulneris]|nr:DUF732 domain-containing protein [Mycolicibacterium vulneris]
MVPAHADSTDDAFLRDLVSSSSTPNQWAGRSFDHAAAVAEAHQVCANIGTTESDSAMMTDIIRKFIDPDVSGPSVSLIDVEAATQLISAAGKNYCPGKKM